jgi:hypothetical protein
MAARRSFAQEGFSVYEVVVRFRQREEVIETVGSREIASARVLAYQRQGLTAYFRLAVRRSA